MRHFLTLNDFTKDEILEILDLAKSIKAETKSKNFTKYLQNQTLAMIFEKSSTRTRVSFEVGMYQLGGHALFLSKNDIQIGRGEPIRDTARVISRMCDMAMLRVDKHETLEEFAKYSSVPVINGLSDLYHPVQLMADYLTMIEHNAGDVVAYVGDGNNMTGSWLMLASKLGLDLRIATPKGYEPEETIVKQAYENAKVSGAKILITNDIKQAVKDASVVTTDTWVSMGQEREKEQRISYFDGFMVNDSVMQLAKEGAMFLHCLPAYRGYEVSESVFEAHANEIFDEAENRLHAQKAIMVWLDRHRNS
ncbi:Ornithine carbamoyltransferase, anabolic [Campylobacter majalis]|uniref:Ornithine carbamoyltransferase n=1 Tax=Campylobacter majalis TaxID=2790656 RepID=A0ABN7K5I9_9BACT|nr:ornithine carbamoyltransferase [Campylobacter majalis]CAD7287784.1 Ornithine carbamoyltransferase, anabolic [Campylobacter majalis]